LAVLGGHALKNNAFLKLARPVHCLRHGPDGGSGKKGVTNVHFAHIRPSDRDRLCRRVHFGSSSRFGRHFAADRVNTNYNLKDDQMNGRFLINRGDAKVMGVAAGLADYTGVDPTIIRLGFIAATLLTGPVMILFYVLAGLLAPTR
jgi:phage shock protein C